jgi:hypothetical protein
MRTPRHDVGQVIREARARGWAVTRTRSGHLRFTGHGAVVIGSSSPSDVHGVSQLRRDLRRAERRHSHA